MSKEERPYIVILARALIHIVANRVGGFGDMPAVHLAEMLIGMGCMGLRDNKVSTDILSCYEIPSTTCLSLLDVVESMQQKA